MPLILIATGGPIGTRVRDGTETRRPTLKLFAFYLHTASLGVCVQRSCVPRGRPCVLAM